MSFYAYTGCHPRWCIIETPKLPINPGTEDRLERLHQIQADLSIHLQQAQQTHKVYADLHRLLSGFKIGDRVLLLRLRPCEKFDYRRLGPFHIIGKINDVTFHLDLPPQLRIHLVFHSSLLEPYQDNTIPGSIIQPPPPIELEDGPEYEVAAILDSRIIRNKLYYLVDWLGYSPSERSWEPIENVTNARALLNAFHRQYPHKPGPRSKTTRDTCCFKGECCVRSSGGTKHRSPTV
jgi:hypothetical protein